MASELIAVHHTCEGLLKFILPEDTVTVDLDVMTLTGVHVYKKDRNSIGKGSSPGVRTIHSLQSFWEKLGRPKDRKQRSFRVTPKPRCGTQF